MSELHDKQFPLIKRGASFEEILRLVVHYKNNGVSQSEIYDALEGIWQELGCAQSTAENEPSCDILGGLMDRVWGYCSSKDAIWDTALSDDKIKK